MGRLSSGGEIRREEVRSKLRILSLSIVKIEEKKTEKKREKNRGLLKKTRPRIFFFLLCFVCCRRIVTSSSRSFSLPHQIKEKQKGEVITKNEKATEQNHF